MDELSKQIRLLQFKDVSYTFFISSKMFFPDSIWAVPFEMVNLNCLVELSEDSLTVDIKNSMSSLLSITFK